MSYAAVATAAQAHALAVRGAFHAAPGDGAPTGTGTILMLGPEEPRFWTAFTASSEYADGQPDPMDRWSKRVLRAIAKEFGGTAIFPSDGPPYPPFIRWARDSGHAWQSPVGLLVHDEAGLFISYRGALALPELLDLPPTGTKPCPTCDGRPCVSACPVNALGLDQDYDTAACKAHIASPEGQECRDNGCLVRRACPVAKNFERLPAQSAFHTASFMKSDMP